MRYIDADVLKKFRDDLIAGKLECPTEGDLIDLVPTADVVEVKHSEWRLHKDGSGTCKRCGFTQKNVWDYDNWQNFCGHCGAKMDGGKTVN